MSVQGPYQPTPSLPPAASRCHELRCATTRPPPCSAANRCLHCSLAPVCLPEKGRLARDPGWDTLRLFPPDDERQTRHVLEHGDRISRA